mgnify:CR=1 FL=1
MVYRENGSLQAVATQILRSLARLRMTVLVRLRLQLSPLPHHAALNAIPKSWALVASFREAGFITGAVVIETVFSWPGMGRVIVDAIFQRDYPLVMATSFIFAVVVVLGSLVADILYAVADPRIRYE